MPLGAGNTAVSAWCAGAVRLHHGGIPVNCRNTRLLPPAIVRKMPTRLAVNLPLHNQKEVMLVLYFLSYQHVSSNRFNVVQQNFFTVSIITKHNHSGGA